MHRVLIVGGVLVLAACSSHKSNGSSDMENVCFAAERSGAASIADLDARTAKTAQWLEANVHDKKLLDQLHALANSDSPDSGQILREIAKEHGYTGACPMADEASKPRPSPLYGWWSITETSSARLEATKGGYVHFAPDELIVVWPEGMVEATAAKTSQNGDDVTIEGRSIFSDKGPVHATIFKRVQLVGDGFAAVAAVPAKVAELDKLASSKLPAADVCERAMACAKEAALVKDKLELRDDPVENLRGAGRTLCDAQLRGNAGMYERAKLSVPPACKSS